MSRQRLKRYCSLREAEMQSLMDAKDILVGYDKTASPPQEQLLGGAAAAGGGQQGDLTLKLARQEEEKAQRRLLQNKGVENRNMVEAYG